MSLNNWADAKSGRDCFLCQPQADATDTSIKVADLSATTLRLERDQTYRGYCILTFTARHATGIEQLTDQEYAAVMQDLRRASLAIATAVKPDHMNYASLGNMVPHLHWHLIPRYKTDPNWRGSIWQSAPELAERKLLASDDDYLKLAAEILQRL